jgi:hypothetical protein
MGKLPPESQSKKQARTAELRRAVFDAADHLALNHNNGLPTDQQVLAVVLAVNRYRQHRWPVRPVDGGELTTCDMEDSYEV